ncbi:Hypothetical protein FKW44_023275 [Caligus rogercresseyi]|uniref:Uncharacterized protein n=1 Tax=Caligus rogercresseyi TaxID=217165 RepID=A0A7T8GP57_CALRO|nr:Hypothetical protein FKW44_023275 [Caligus rogercresseyi]
MYTGCACVRRKNESVSTHCRSRPNFYFCWPPPTGAQHSSSGSGMWMWLVIVVIFNTEEWGGGGPQWSVAQGVKGARLPLVE